MSFSAYPEYKDSGVEWLGKVPEHWSVLPVKWVGWLKGGAGFPHDKQGVDSHELDFHKVNALASADSDGVLRSSENTVTREIARELGAYVFPKGTIVFAKVGAALLLGRLRTIGAEACIDNNMMGLVAFQGKVSNQFALYSMGTVRFDLIANPGAVPSLNEGQIGNYRLAIPSFPEQAHIARFLDHETARIDGLIEEQMRLIELLKEKRQSVISHAVTKGLDPTVPMKNSGVEWLGEVPEHWMVKKVKHYGRVVGGFAFKSTDFCDEGHLVIKISNVGHLGFEWDDSSYLPEDFAREHSEFIAPKGSLIFAMTRPIISGGIKVSRLEEDLRPLINQRVGFVSIDDEIVSRYLLVSSQSESFLGQFKNNLTITNQPNISSEGIESIQIAIPPREELRTILDYLEGLNSSFKCLVVDAQCGIELLQERRSALISAAVTGKIDVRSWQPPTSAPSPRLEKEAV